MSPRPEADTLSPDHRPDRGGWLLLPLAVVLAAIGVTPLADHMTQRVLDQCAQIPWSSFFLPFRNPPPMDAVGVRPASVLLLKLYELVIPAAAAPPGWLIWLRAAIILALYGIAARSWLRRAGPDLAAVATPAAVGACLLGPTLFSAWYLPEFDTLGAAATLATLCLLRAPTRPTDLPAPLRYGMLIPAAVIALGLKESSALMALALLVAGQISSHVQGDLPAARRHQRMLIAGGIAWILLIIPMARLSSGNATLDHAAWFDRLPILRHNLLQHVYLLGPAGCAVAAAALLSDGARGRAAVAPLAPLAAAAALLASPLLVYYSHYEAIYYAPPGPPLWLGLALCARLLHLWRSAPASGEAAIARGFFAAMILYGLALLASPTAREDLASRIFLAQAPLLLAVALADLRRLWLQHPRPISRAPTLLLGAALAWYPAASAFNFSADWRARQTIEHAGRADLAAALAADRSGSPEPGAVLFNHYVQLLGAQELRVFSTAARPIPDLSRRFDFLQVTAWPPDLQLPDAHWGARADLRARHRQGAPIYLYWLSPRARMDPGAAAMLQGDLSYTRLPYGVFGPYDLRPGPALAVPAEELPPSPAPPWNRMEEARLTTFSPAEPYLRGLFRIHGQEIASHEHPFLQIPPTLTEIPLRLLAGVPLIERYAYEQGVYRMDPAR